MIAYTYSLWLLTDTYLWLLICSSILKLHISCECLVNRSLILFIHMDTVLTHAYLLTCDYLPKQIMWLLIPISCDCIPTKILWLLTIWILWSLIFAYSMITHRWYPAGSNPYLPVIVYPCGSCDCLHTYILQLLNPSRSLFTHMNLVTAYPQRSCICLVICILWLHTHILLLTYKRSNITIK